ncbi:hypothetical protein T069G_08609 [Trichoderma breve]|uniref:Uncharacterized protein n=1 Tax=Trichoderma breve TaxID=2034170 RepID=A0A9W9B6X8_9HYPO|nr:hypothetical protein T069G_08609 [Trichoderma breve]KAJ4857712.1 hypothetical protein T069G_08609 [Trichoderma breve]
MTHEQQSTVTNVITRTDSPSPSVMVWERMTITREDAVIAVRGLIDTIWQSPWDVNLNNKLRETFTEQMVIVLPADIKEELTTWAKMSGSTCVEAWLERATEDKLQHTWIEVRENPLLWSRRGPTAILDEMRQVMDVEGVDEAARRRKMHLLIDQMQVYIP